MAKDTYWFPHDDNALGDVKCTALIDDFGLEGYGVYWAMIETLAQQEDYRLEKFPALYKGLARRWNISADRLQSIVQAMLDRHLLLVEDESHIWSESLTRRLEARAESREKRAAAGRQGGLKTAAIYAQNKQCSSNAEAPLKQKRREEKRAQIPSPGGDDAQAQGCPWCERPRAETEGTHFLLQQWHDRFKQVFSVCPTIAPARDGNLLKATCRAGRTESEIAQAMTTFFRTADEWTRANGLTVGVFAKRIDSLRTKGRQHAGRRVDDDDDRI